MSVKAIPELIEKGVEPEVLEALYNDEKFYELADKLDEIQVVVDQLESEGMSAKDVITYAKSTSVVADEQKDNVTVQSVNSATEQTNDKQTNTNQSIGNSVSVKGNYTIKFGDGPPTFGMKFLPLVSEIKQDIERIEKETGVDFDTVTLVMGTLLTGPARVVGEVVTSAAVDSVAGEVINDTYENAANYVTGQAYVIGKEKVENWTSADSREKLEGTGTKDERYLNALTKSQEGARFLLETTTGIIGIGVGTKAGNGQSKGDDYNSGANKTSDIDGNSTNDYTGTNGIDGIPDVVTRSDDDFYSNQNYLGAPKASFDSNGNLVAPNLNGTGTIVSHIRGGNSQNSSYISTTDPSIASPKDYGSEKITIDTIGLQEAIDKGDASGVKIIPHHEVLNELENKVSQSQIRYNENPSINNLERLNRSNRDLENALRDGEVLIQGTIPSEFIQLNK